MFMTRLHRRITAWVALLALVLGALAPAVTQARVAGADRGDWVQICSASGMVWVQADSLSADPTDRADRSLPSDLSSPDCPWCTLHGGAAGLPAHPVAVALPAGPAAVPPLHRQAPRAEARWVPAQSRAPPAA